MLVEVITPDQVVYSGEAESVKLPGASGQFEALNNHAPLISGLDAGQVVVKNQGRRAKLRDNRRGRGDSQQQDHRPGLSQQIITKQKAPGKIPGAFSF